jgi:MFS family permease
MALVPSIRVFRHAAYARYWIMRQFLAAARQIQSVAIGWQVYDLARQTRSVEESALVLGLVGLAQFLPVLVLSLFGGQLADRFDRRLILIIANTIRLFAGLTLLATPMLGTDSAIALIFCVAVVLGAVNAFTPAASSALYPTLVPRAELTDAIAWNSLGFQLASIAGPALGGFLYLGGTSLVYGVSAAMTAAAIIAISLAKTPRQPNIEGVNSMRMMMEGLRYVGANKVVLGAISLDLTVVFFGGATALLPVFARDILHAGSDGLGLLRAAPAFGAAIVALGLAIRPLTRKVGPVMLVAIGIYGAATILFGVSKLFWLSMAALAVTGAADMISVYVRQTLIQLATPDAMRGRVSSVSYIFISASNELGEFESGVAARLLGPVGAVLLGGGVAVAAALGWRWLFPALSRADRVEETAEVLASEPERIAPAKPVS